jgi:DNA-binding NtrC family response regulator
MLLHLGHEVEAVGDGALAVESYRKAREAGNSFDMVIMDLVVAGGMDGKEAVQKMIEYDPGVKAVISSGYSSGPVITDFEKFGFCGLLKKPFRMADLSETINQVLE